MKLSIVEYVGSCDENKNPIGHTLKTLKDYGECLKNDLEVEYIVPEIYRPYLDADFKVMGMNIFTSSTQTKTKKLKNIILKIFAILRILRASKDSDLWFINTEFWFYLVICFYRGKRKKIFGTSYVNYDSLSGLKGFLKRFIYKKAINRMEYIFTSDSSNLSAKHVFIPDYFFESKKYERYISDKSDMAVCLGDMNPGKQIEEMIDVFNENRIKLIIAGKFSSEELYNKLKSKAKQNIEIRNCFVDSDEYYRMLGNARYCVLPYKEKNYNKRSSGVLLESIFLETIVIAPKFLLDYNEIKGIGYENIYNLANLDLDLPREEIDKIKKANNTKKNEYDKEIIRKRLCEIFNPSAS